MKPTRIELTDALPDSIQRASLMGVPKHYIVYRDPEDLLIEDVHYMYVARAGEELIPHDAILLTNKETGQALEKKHNLKRVFNNMTDAEKAAALGD